MRPAVAVGLGLAVVLLAGGCTADDSAGAPQAPARTAAPPAPPGGVAGAATPATPASGDPPATTTSSGPAKDGSQAVVLGRAPGDASGACVKVDGHRDVRSGSVMGGPFDTAVGTWGKARPGLAAEALSLYWVPLHTNVPKPELTVEATRLGSKDRVSASTGSLEEADQWKYFTTELRLNAVGTWRLEVAAGADRGCFELTLGK